MEQHAVLGWFINDLSRAPIPYHVIKSVAKLARLHPFVQYDAPVSVARAFIRQDWQALIAAAGLYESDAVIESIQAGAPVRLSLQANMERGQMTAAIEVNTKLTTSSSAEASPAP